MRVDPDRVREFTDGHGFYTWLGKHWDREAEVWIKIHKLRSGLQSITPAEAIDVALCWGWIDGIRKGFDEYSFLQRYSPRSKKSVWSQINVANVERLIAGGRMRPPGLVQVESAKMDGRWDKAYRMTDKTVPDDLMSAIRAEPKALATFESLSAQNRFALTFRVNNLKTANARQRKIQTFVAMLKRGETIHPNRAAKAPAPSDGSDH